MTEEIRFFVRIALYALLITAVYWFLSYELAGSVLLLVLGLAALFFGCVMAWTLRAQEGARPIAPRAPLAFVRKTIGFDDPQRDDATSPIEIDDAPLPTASIWPLLVALAILFVALGLLFGGWLWIPGALLAAMGAWGWLTQTEV